jgi:putative sigma-54 modulation protein
VKYKIQEIEMDLQLSGKNTEISPAIRDYVEKKLNRLTRYLTGIEEIKAEITEEKTRMPKDRFTVQITLNSRGNILRSEERASNINLATDKVVKLLARQIRRFKGRLVKKGRGGTVEAVQENAKYEQMDAIQKIVRVKKFPVKSLSTEEAAEQMELLSHDFFLFANASTGKLNLLYRRKAGNYGVIEPEME